MSGPIHSAHSRGGSGGIGAAEAAKGGRAADGPPEGGYAGQEAIFNSSEIVEVGVDTLGELKLRAARAPRRRFRLCLHRSLEDVVQEMLIVFCRGSYVRPHRHTDGRSESLHVLEGTMAVFLFDDEGNVTRRIELSAHDRERPFLYRLAAPTWHMPVPMSDTVIVHEASEGPRRANEGVEYPAWCPDEKDGAAVEAFLACVTRDPRRHP